MVKNNSIHIKVSAEQKNKLKEKAQELGISLSSYCLLVLINTPTIQLFNKSFK